MGSGWENFGFWVETWENFGFWVETWEILGLKCSKKNMLCAGNRALVGKGKFYVEMRRCAQGKGMVSQRPCPPFPPISPNFLPFPHILPWELSPVPPPRMESCRRRAVKGKRTSSAKQNPHQCPLPHHNHNHHSGARTPPCMTFRLVVVSLRGPGQSPVLPFACCVGSPLSTSRCGRCSCWCRFRVRGAQWLGCWGCAGCGGVCRLCVSGAQ